jgi:CRP-like cAMP-binding protein
MIFNNVNDNDKKELLKKINIKTKEYLRGEAIYLENELCNEIAIIKRGNIKASKAYNDGHEKIIRLLNQNEIIGLSLLFSSHPYYKATFTSEGLSTLIIINKDDLLYLMDNNLNIKLNVLSYISDHSIRLNEHIKLLSYKTIRQKLCAFLYNEYKTKGATSFLIQYTKTELAAFLNVERPSLSYELSRLINDGIIANQNKLYTIINIEKLEREI